MTKVVLIGYILVPASDLEVIKRELQTHIQLTLQEPGCVVFNVTQSEKNPCRFEVYEEFSDANAFEFHQTRVKSSPWGAASKNVTRHYEIQGWTSKNAKK